MTELERVGAKLIRSRRRRMVVQVDEDGNVIVRAPLRMPQGEIENFLISRRDWIALHRQKAQARRRDLDERAGAQFTEEQMQQLVRNAKNVIPLRTAYFAQKMGVNYGRITIRCQKSRWGSCSSLGNLNFNCLLAAAPPEILDYVVVHELCHRLYMNHSYDFWSAVERVLPDYRLRIKWLKSEGAVLMRRVPR